MVLAIRNQGDIWVGGDGFFSAGLLLHPFACSQGFYVVGPVFVEQFGDSIGVLFVPGSGEAGANIRGDEGRIRACHHDIGHGA